MVIESGRIELRLSAEEKQRWMEQANEFGLSLSEWIRRRCSQGDVPGQNGSDGACEARTRTSVYLGARNVKKVRLYDFDIRSMLRSHRHGLPADIRVQDCQVDSLGVSFTVSSDRFAFVPYGCSIPELPRW